MGLGPISHSPLLQSKGPKVQSHSKMDPSETP